MATPVGVFQSLQAARAADQQAQAQAFYRTAELEFLQHLPLRLGIAGAFLAYGFAKPSTWAKWAGGLDLVWIGLDYLAARRQQQLTASTVGGTP